jgi:hypothetical protein
VTYSRGDALFYEPHGFNGPCWISWFDATNSGLGPSTDINALHDACGPGDPGCDIYLSFKANTNVPGVGVAHPQDVVRASFAGGLDTYDNWQMIFDGSDVGLTTTGERIDALFRFQTDTPGPYPPASAPAGQAPRPNCDELLLISTASSYSVADQWGGTLRGGGEDVLGFCASALGWDTSGYWFLYHDGSAQGMPSDALIGLSHEGGKKGFNRFDFLTDGAFAVDSANGGHSEVFRFMPKSGEYVGPTFSFPEEAKTVDKIDSFSVYYE